MSDVANGCVVDRNNVERKQRVETEASRLMDAGVAGQAFPGGVACISWREGDELVYVDVAAGKLRAGEPEVKPATPYDLASITKPIVAMAALRLVATGKLSLDTRTDTVVSDVRGAGAGPGSVAAARTDRARPAHRIRTAAAVDGAQGSGVPAPCRRDPRDIRG